MIFFWDKNLPRSIPEALRLMKPPFGIEIYLERYPRSDNYKEGGDDRWLPEVGAQRWFVITQDYQLHVKDNERRAIQDYGIGVFYLWGAEAPKWDIMRLFASSYGGIASRAQTIPRPFIYRVSKTGRISNVPLSKGVSKG